MDTLGEILTEAVHPINFALTAALVGMVGYWMLVIFGCLGGEHVDGDADVQADVQSEADLHADAEADAGTLDADGDADAGGDDVHHETGTFGHGSTQLLLRFLHVGDVPLMPLVSCMVLQMWCISLLSNHYWNPNKSWIQALLLLAGNLVVTAVMTHFLAYPLKAGFRAMNQDVAAPAPIPGSLCRIATSRADAEFGVGIIERTGAPLQINVRTSGETLHEGERALVVKETTEPGTYLIVRFEPKTSNPVKTYDNTRRNAPTSTQLRDRA